MSISYNYRPSDLAFYTTWWLNSKTSISSQGTLLSTDTSTKTDDECLSHQTVIILPNKRALKTY